LKQQIFRCNFGKQCRTFAKRGLHKKASVSQPAMVPTRPLRNIPVGARKHRQEPTRLQTIGHRSHTTATWIHRRSYHNQSKTGSRCLTKSSHGKAHFFSMKGERGTTRKLNFIYYIYPLFNPFTIIITIFDYYYSFLRYFLLIAILFHTLHVLNGLAYYNTISSGSVTMSFPGGM
jgi:hypothetical protein